MTVTEQLTLFGRSWPLWLTTTTLREYEPVACEIDREGAAEQLKQALLFRLDQLMEANGGETLRTDFSVREADGRLTVTLLAECREEIGRTVERDGEIGRVYGTWTDEKTG